MKTLSSVIIASVALVLCSCSSTPLSNEAKTTPGYVWYEGTLKKTLPASLPRISEVTQQTLGELDLVGVDAVIDKLKGEITARMADGTKVKIHLKAVDFERTTVQIKVGLLGDPAVSEQIFRHIERAL